MCISVLLNSIIAKKSNFFFKLRERERERVILIRLTLFISIDVIIDAH